MTKEEVLKMIQESLERQDTEEVSTLLFSIVFLKEDKSERLAQIASGSVADLGSIMYELGVAIGYENFVSVSEDIIEQLSLEKEDDNR